MIEQEKYTIKEFVEKYGGKEATIRSRCKSGVYNELTNQDLRCVRHSINWIKENNRYIIIVSKDIDGYERKNQIYNTIRRDIPKALDTLYRNKQFDKIVKIQNYIKSLNEES